jgi:type IX secretion system PorP/SprF family membrane protein
MMNRFVLGILIIFIPFRVTGQLFTLSDQYLNNTIAINPAFAGSNGALSLTAVYRNQWNGFEGSPVNSTISIHTPLHKDKIGLGFMLSDGSYGINKETVLTGNYAYRMELSRGILALGLGFGATFTNVAWNELRAYDPDDELLMNNPVSAILPDVSIGTYYYAKNLFIGFSVPMLLSHKPDHSTGKYDIENDFDEYSYFLEGGYYFRITKGIRLLPSVLLNYEKGKTPVLNYNAQIVFKDILRIGGGYRQKDVVIGMVQLNLNRQLMLAYSYDYAVGTSLTYADGTHEILLNYTFSYSRRVMSPRQF